MMNNNNNFANSSLGGSYPGGRYPSTYAAAASSTAHTYRYSGESDDDDNDEIPTMPWDQYGWIPREKSGKQTTPNKVRNELQRYIDQCKAEGSLTQTRIIEQMGVNSNSFRKFMDPATYKNQWSATANGTYWAAAKLLARLAHEKELAKMTGKRKIAVATAGAATDSPPRKKNSTEAKLGALELIRSINAVDVSVYAVYDTCPQVVAGINSFLQRDGMTKAYLLSALGDINSNSLNTFLSGKKQDQCGNVTYRAAYVFLEKLRILEGKSKSAARRINEVENPRGVRLYVLFVSPVIAIASQQMMFLFVDEC
ncbi:hypothetical protein ACHAW5_000350 [Stephanodiscus triporus]|uniref:DUF7726 domain-containing protein n=1 Tax=Stephanodiscus triporus TaxID=2934178 RepID=A0ABD3MNJ1_9STRA